MPREQWTVVRLSIWWIPPDTCMILANHSDGVWILAYLHLAMVVNLWNNTRRKGLPATHIRPSSGFPSTSLLESEREEEEKGLHNHVCSTWHISQSSHAHIPLQHIRFWLSLWCRPFQCFLSDPSIRMDEVRKVGGERGREDRTSFYLFHGGDLRSRNDDRI